MKLQLTSPFVMLPIIFAFNAAAPTFADVLPPTSTTTHVKGRVLDAAGHAAADAKLSYVRFNQPAGDIVEAQSIPVGADGSFDASVAYEPLIGGRPYAWIAENKTGICVFTLPFGIQPSTTSTLKLRFQLVPKVDQTVKLMVDGRPAAHIKLRPTYFQYTDKDHESSAVWPDQYSQRWAAESGDDGTVTLTGLPSGYKVYFDIEDDQYATPSYLDYYPIDPRSTINISLHRAGSIAGRLTYPDGQPVVGARCRASIDRGYSAFAMSDGDGRYHMDRLAPGTYSLVVADVGSDWAAPWSSQATVTAGQSTTHDFAITHGALIVGKVLDKATGLPVPGLNVGPSGLDYDRNRVQTASDGSYKIRVCPGRQYLYLYGLGTVSTKAVDAAEGQTLTVDIRIDVPSPPVPITGSVVDGGGKAVVGARVEAIPYDGELLGDKPAAVTDAHGQFTFPTSSLAAEVAIVAKSGHSATVRPVITTRGANVAVRLQPDATVTVTGVIRDTRHKALHGIDVQLVRSIRLGGSMVAHAKTNSRGHYAFNNLVPGVFYSTWVSQKGYCDGYGMQFKAQPGQRKAINIDLEFADSSVSGVVLHADGKPFTNVQLHDGATFNTTVTTDVDGRFHLDGVPRGPSKLYVLGTPNGAECRITGGQTNVKIVVDEAPHAPSTYDYSRHITARYDALTGTVAPDFATTAWVNSPPLSLGALRGKVVLVAFWQSGCAPCCANLPAIESLWKKYQAKGLVVVGLHAAINEDNAKRYAVKHGYDFPITFNSVDKDHDSFGKTFTRYTVDGLPCVAVIDTTGRIVSIGDETPVVVKTVELLLQGERIFRYQ